MLFLYAKVIDSLFHKTEHIAFKSEKIKGSYEEAIFKLLWYPAGHDEVTGYSFTFRVTAQTWANRLLVGANRDNDHLIHVLCKGALIHTVYNRPFSDKSKWPGNMFICQAVL